MIGGPLTASMATVLVTTPTALLTTSGCGSDNGGTGTVVIADNATMWLGGNLYIGKTGAAGATEREQDPLTPTARDQWRDIVRQVIIAEVSMSDLARRYPMSMTAVQKHIGVLEGAGLVSKHRQGREQRVRVRVEALQRAQGLLDELEKMWRDRFDRIGELLAAPTKEGTP